VGLLTVTADTADLLAVVDPAQDLIEQKAQVKGLGLRHWNLPGSFYQAS
jgi:hypothetical protein